MEVLVVEVSSTPSHPFVFRSSQLKLYLHTIHESIMNLCQQNEVTYYVLCFSLKRMRNVFRNITAIIIIAQ